MGSCSYGTNCKFEHAGQAGALRYTVADADGNCLMEFRKGVCSRRNCPFTHKEGESDKALTSGPESAPRMFSILPKDDPGDTPRMFGMLSLK